MKASKLLPLTAALALGLSLGQSAQAAVYGAAYNNVFDLFVAGGYTSTDSTVGSGDINVIDLGSGNFYHVNPAAAGMSFGATTSTSYSAAQLAPAALIGNTVVGTNADALPSQFGVAKANNDMTRVGPSDVFSYARGDAQIVSEQTVTGTPAQAWNIAEANRPSPDGRGYALGQGDNFSGTNFQVTFVLAAPAQIMFTGKADPFIELIMAAGERAGSFVRGTITSNINITQVGGFGGTVFNWAPDGQSGGITGGVELLDQASLNVTGYLDHTTPGTSTFDPTGNGNVDVGDLTPSTWANYAALTDVLLSGTYTLNIAMSEKVELNRVPEPATLGLLGIGLIGMAFANRRRKV